MKHLYCLILFFCLLTARAEADNVGLTLNDFSAQLEYRHILLEDSLGKSAVFGRLLYNDDQETRIGSAGFELIGEPGNIMGLEVGASLQLYGGDTDADQDSDQDLVALAVGARSEYYPPMLGGLGASAKLFYAPEILSFIDAERLFEAGVGLGFAFTPRVRLVVEYQAIRAGFEEQRNTWTIDETVRAGFLARF